MPMPQEIPLNKRVASSECPADLRSQSTVDSVVSRNKMRHIFLRALCWPWGVVIWYALVTIPLLLLSPPVYTSGGDEIPNYESLQLYNIISIVCIVVYILSNARLALRVFEETVSFGGWFNLIYFICLLQIIISLILLLVPESALYSVIWIITIVMGQMFWLRPRSGRSLCYGAMLITSTIQVGLSLAMSGISESRFVGGIHPNMFSQNSIAICFLASSIGGIIQVPVWIAALYLAIAVSSRYAVLACCVFIITVVFYSDWGRRGGVLKVMLVIFLAVSFLISTQIAELNDKLRSIMELDDPLRGIGSGISGRFENHYIYFLPQFYDNFFIGYGFRNKEAYISPHNGYLTFILENGLFISLMFFIFLIWRGVSLHHMLRSWKFKGRNERNECVAVIALYISLLVSSLFQPQIVNFADQFAVLTALCFSYMPQGYTFGDLSHPR